MDNYPDLYIWLTFDALCEYRIDIDREIDSCTNIIKYKQPHCVDFEDTGVPTIFVMCQDISYQNVFYF